MFQRQFVQAKFPNSEELRQMTEPNNAKHLWRRQKLHLYRDETILYPADDFTYKDENESLSYNPDFSPDDKDIEGYPPTNTTKNGALRHK